MFRFVEHVLGFHQHISPSGYRFQKLFSSDKFFWGKSKSVFLFSHKKGVCKIEIGSLTRILIGLVVLLDINLRIGISKKGVKMS